MKYVLPIWLLLGVALGLAYFTPAAQRSIRQSTAEEPLQSAQKASNRARTLSTGTDRSDAAKTAAEAEWKKVLGAADVAIAALVEPAGPAKVLAEVLRAEAMAHTGAADEAYQKLVTLEEQVLKEPHATEAESVKATLAQTNYQIALMVHAESSDDNSWIKYAEKASAYYQDLLKDAADEASADAYRKNLACVTRFLYGKCDSSECWSMPPVRTKDCKRKMHRIEREQKGGGGTATRYQKPRSDNYDPIRQKDIERTQDGKDDGK